jgi:dipeptidyl aminopeptidase/acylaminoacyl peptidase|tara:strand:- start:12630 stop:14564 length:1935 start_codon:yes stop_codon:yes gene_type:complete
MVWAGRPITAEDVVNLRYITQPAIDPSGKYIAYVKVIPRNADEKRGGSYREIWVTAAKGSDQRQYTYSPVNSWSPQWTPDGNLSFLSNRKDHHASTQIYILPFRGGEAKLLTNHKTGVGSYQWSPDGKWIAFTSRDGKSAEKKKAEKEGYDMIVMDQDHTYTRLWIYNVKTGAYQKVFKKDLNVASFVWAPDSKFIVFQATDKTGADRDLLERSIYRVKAPSGNPRKVLETPGKLGDMALSPNNENLAFLGATSYNDPLSQSIYVVPVKGGKANLLTPDFKESFVAVDWMDDNTVLGKSYRGTKTVLSTIDTKDKSPEGVANQTDVLAPNEILSSVSYHKPSGKLVITASGHAHPNELYVGSLGSSEIKRLTKTNPGLNQIDFAKQETISWTGPDGLEIEGVLTYPLKYRKGKRYPLVLQIHGGPEGTSLDGWNTRATYPVQLLAAEGFVVLEPNYRGSGGKGVAFSKADHDDLGGLEFDDVLAGIDHLVAQGIVDDDKVGTGGWSYGGYFSAWGATKHTDRFKASMVGAGLTNMISFMGTTDIPYEMSVVHWNQWWFDNPEFHWERSPLSHINKAKTPTLVIHGLKDVRVHPEQGLELWQTLKIKGVDTELVLYPREPHGLLERAHKLDYMERLVSWYKKYVK